MSHEASPALLERYAQALDRYLRDGSEALRAEAYVLGRAALGSGIGLLELIQVHQAAATASEGPRSWEYLAEVIGPFEMALRGYREANGRLQSLSGRLQEEVEARTAELREAEHRFRSLVEHLPAVTYVSAGDPARLEYVSPQVEAVLGERAAALVALGPAWLDRVDPADRERVESSFRDRVPGTRCRLDYRVHSANGRTVWVSDDALVLANPRGGEPVRQGIWMDITDRHALEEQLRHAQRMEAMGQLAGGVAHDFNNVLTAILSFGSFVLQDLPPAHTSFPDVQEVVKAGERGAALTRQLLALGRRQVFSPTLLELNDVVCEMERLLQRLLGARVSLETRLAADPWPLFADRGQLEQVLLNLVVNARDAQPDGGRILVETRNATLAAGEGRFGAPAGDYAMVAVTDSGVGIDSATLARIFEPFFTTKPLGKGTGLGLAVVSSIVKQSNGELVVESAPGRGTTFRIYLPRAQVLARPVGVRADRPVRTGTETVLLVEDSPEVRAAARRILTATGYRVLEAATAGEAEQLARAHPGEIALLLTDVVLADRTGPALADLLRTQRPAAKVLFMSGDTGEEAVHRAVLESGGAYLQKPFTPSSLGEKVREVLDAAGSLAG